MRKIELPSICLIISTESIPKKLEIALKSGIKWVQYREKVLTRKNILKYAHEVRELTYKYNSLLTINDFVDIAIAVEADGVHLGQDDLPIDAAKKIYSGIIGLSTHTLEEALEAQNMGVDYIGFGPLFPTNTKKDALSPRSFKELELVLNSIWIPTLLIGGIKEDNLKILVEKGCRNIAVSSGILEGNIAKNVDNFLKFFNHFS